jgi:hypothetical protein
MHLLFEGDLAVDGQLIAAPASAIDGLSRTGNEPCCFEACSAG